MVNLGSWFCECLFKDFEDSFCLEDVEMAGHRGAALPIVGGVCVVFC